MISHKCENVDRCVFKIFWKEGMLIYLHINTPPPATEGGDREMFSNYVDKICIVSFVERPTHVSNIEAFLDFEGL